MEFGYEDITFPGMDSSGVPFQVNFDDLASVRRVDSNGSMTSSNMNSSMGKNKRLASDIGSDASKKRFVWPDALHRDFMSAVFDIGLQSAPPKEILSLMGPTETPISNEQLAAAVQKFTAFRERGRDYVSFTDQIRGGGGSGGYKNASSASFQPTSATTSRSFNTIASEGSTGGGGGLQPSSSVNSLNGPFPSPNPLLLSGGSATDNGNSNYSSSNGQKPINTQQNATAAAATTALLSKIDAMGEAIAAQQAHIAHLKQLVRKQQKIHNLLTQKANEIKAVLPSSDPKRLYNAFANRSIRNTCGTLYKMNIVTGDTSYGLSFIDATAKHQYNDGFNYNYTNNSGEEVAEQLSFLRNAPTKSSGGGNSSSGGGVSSQSSNRSGVQYMHEMRANMDIHRQLLLRKEDQLSQHNCNVYLPSVYSSEENCGSGYNSFTDHHRYHGYKYTAEDNKLCFTGPQKYSALSQRLKDSGGANAHPGREVKEEDEGVDNVRRNYTYTPTHIPQSSEHNNNSSSSSNSRSGVPPLLQHTVGDNNSSSRDVPCRVGTSYAPPGNNVKSSALASNSISSSSNSHMPPYCSSNSGISNGSSSGSNDCSVPNTHAHMPALPFPGVAVTGNPVVGVNPITGMAELQFTEADLDMDLFSFLMDVSPRLTD